MTENSRGQPRPWKSGGGAAGQSLPPTTHRSRGSARRPNVSGLQRTARGVRLAAFGYGTTVSVTPDPGFPSSVQTRVFVPSTSVTGTVSDSGAFPPTIGCVPTVTPLRSIVPLIPSSPFPVTTSEAGPATASNGHSTPTGLPVSRRQSTGPNPAGPT